MESCILCLKLKEKLVYTILIDSKEWNELNIQYVLDKYLWPMNHVESNSWICTTCWEELCEFHKFYTRIEEAHRNHGLFVSNTSASDKNNSNNSESEKTIPITMASLVIQGEPIKVNVLEDNLDNKLEEIPVSELKKKANESDLKDYFLQRELLNDHKPSIKNELYGVPSTDKNPLLEKRKRGRPRKLDSNIKSIGASNERKMCHKHSIKSGCHNTINECGKIRQDGTKERLRQKNKSIEIYSSTNAQYSVVNEDTNRQIASVNPELKHEKSNNPNNDTDRESVDETENKYSINTYTKSKINHNEKDKFLAEHFKITCFLCNIPFETFFNMCKHFDEHHKERGHVKCCNKKFYRRSILVDHVHYHLNPNYFKCSQCGKVMADRRCLELHVEIHGGNHEKNHCCDICGKGFAKLGVLKKHRMIHLSEEEKRFSCSACCKNFASNYLLSSHYRSVHLKKYAKICDICGKSIRCKDVFERHMLQHEGKSAPSVNCDVCGLVLTDKKALKRHKDIIHPVGGQHEYTCSICSKTSPNLRAHKRHVQYKHVMGYDYKCTICQKAFKRAPTLKEHMASHTGTILYTCPWCPKTFNSNANMHNHRKRIHPKEWEEASRKRYSGNLPPNYKPPNITDSAENSVPIDE